MWRLRRRRQPPAGCKTYELWPRPPYVVLIDTNGVDPDCMHTSCAAHIFEDFSCTLRRETSAAIQHNRLGEARVSLSI
jgi:hypothetical protein